MNSDDQNYRIFFNTTKQDDCTRIKTVEWYSWFWRGKKLHKIIYNKNNFFKTKALESGTKFYLEFSCRKFVKLYQQLYKWQTEQQKSGTWFMLNDINGLEWSGGDYNLYFPLNWLSISMAMMHERVKQIIRFTVVTEECTYNT